MRVYIYPIEFTNYVLYKDVDSFEPEVLIEIPDELAKNYESAYNRFMILSEEIAKIKDGKSYKSWENANRD